MKYNLKFLVCTEMFTLILGTFVIILASIGFYIVGRKNIRLHKMSDDTIGYFRHAKSQSKVWLFCKGFISLTLSIAYLISVPFYIYYILTPVIKDIPSLINNSYSYTVGTIYNIQIEKGSNIIFISDLKLYEDKVFVNGKLKQDKKYKIAYLNNTHRCVGFEELK